jgi:hypothetical protein
VQSTMVFHFDEPSELARKLTRGEGADSVPHGSLQGIYSTASQFQKLFPDTFRGDVTGCLEHVITAAQITIGARFSVHTVSSCARHAAALAETMRR